MHTGKELADEMRCHRMNAERIYVDSAVDRKVRYEVSDIETYRKMMFIDLIYYIDDFTAEHVGEPI